MMKIYITAGEWLNNILTNIYKGEKFIPFREAMIIGTYSNKLFSEEFLLERSEVHKVSLKEYKEKISCFINVLENINSYDEIVLWFGDEPFCVENTKIDIKTIEEHNYTNKLILNIVDEITGKVLKQSKIQ